MKQFIIISCVLLFTSVSTAQVAYLYSEVDSVLIGESFDIKIEFAGINPADIISVDWDTLNRLDHLSLIDSQLYNVDFDLEMGDFGGDDYLFNTEELKWEKDDQAEPPSFSNTVKFTVWELCILGIPGPTVTFSNGSEITLNPRYIFVKDPLMRDVQGLSPSLDILREQVTWLDLVKEHWLLISSILLFLLLVPLAVWFSRRKPKEKSIDIIEEEPEPIPVIPPHIIAMEKLEKLKRSRVWETDEDKHFVSGLTDIIREYIENRFGVLALEMTSQEINDAMRKEVLTTEQLSQLQQTLNVSDMIKFAKAKADSNLYEKFVDDAIDLVDETKKVENEK